jgi:DNA polymerase-3 subunit gamma/tau
LFGAMDAIGAHDARAALHAAARLASSGRDLGQVMRDLESHARELLVVQTLEEVPAELHVTPDRDARLEEQSTRIGRADLVRFLELLADAMKAVKDGADARTRVELALVEAASPQIDPSAKALMARLERLEAALAGNGAAPAAAPAPAVAPPEAAPAPRAAAPAPSVEPAAAPEPPRAEAAVAVAEPEPAPAPVAGLDGMTALWPAVRDAVCADNQLVGAALAEARPVDLRDHELVVAFDRAEAFSRRMVDTLEHRAVVEAALRGLAGRPLKVSFELRDLEPEEAEAAAPPPSEDEIVARFVTEFDAQEIVPDPDDDKEGES